MTRDDAMQCGLGYAWGREDASGIRTVGSPDRVTSLEFAEAFAAGWDDYNSEARGNMTDVRSAYERWQATGGKSIFPEGDTTPEQRARHEEYRRMLAG